MPKNQKGLIVNPTTIGEKLRNRRLELNLFQKEVAEILNITVDTITNWENNRYQPQIRYAPKVIEFLGYNPYGQTHNSVGERIKKYRHDYGLSYKRMGILLTVDASTIRSWENENNAPRKKIINHLNKLLKSNTNP